jgi:hypothetical protein
VGPGPAAVRLLCWRCCAGAAVLALLCWRCCEAALTLLCWCCCAGAAALVLLCCHEAACDPYLPTPTITHPAPLAGVLANVFLECGGSLQLVLRRAISEWRLVSRALRPRLLWVAAQHLELPAGHEETWHHLVGCLEDQLLRIWRMEQVGRPGQALLCALSFCHWCA